MASNLVKFGSELKSLVSGHTRNRMKIFCVPFFRLPNCAVYSYVDYSKDRLKIAKTKDSKLPY